MKTKYIKSVISLTLVACMLFGTVMIASAIEPRIELRSVSPLGKPIIMNEGQFVYVYNLVYRTDLHSQLPTEFCKSVSGFSAKSSDSSVLSCDKTTGKVTAKATGEADLTVKKSGKTFVFHFVVYAGKPFKAKDLKWINAKVATLSEKYPKYSSLSGRYSTFMKSWSLLCSRISSYTFEHEKNLNPNFIEDWENSGDDEYVPGRSTVGFAGEYDIDFNGNRYILIPESRDYYRLKSYAEKYLESQRAKTKPISIKSAKLKYTGVDSKQLKNPSTYSKLTITLYSPLTANQCISSHSFVSPYFAVKSWKTDLEASYSFLLYRVDEDGKTTLVEDYENRGETIKGKIGGTTLTISKLHGVLPGNIDDYNGKELKYRLIIWPACGGKVWAGKLDGGKNGITFDFTYKG